MDGQRIRLGGLMNKQGFFWLNADEGEDTFLREKMMGHKIFG